MLLLETKTMTLTVNCKWFREISEINKLVVNKQYAKIFPFIRYFHWPKNLKPPNYIFAS